MVPKGPWSEAWQIAQRCDHTGSAPTTRRGDGCSGPGAVIRSNRAGLTGPVVAERYGGAACGRPR